LPGPIETGLVAGHWFLSAHHGQTPVQLLIRFLYQLDDGLDLLAHTHLLGWLTDTYRPAAAP
jgi:hypothetical protein